MKASDFERKEGKVREIILQRLLAFSDPRAEQAADFIIDSCLRKLNPGRDRGVPVVLPESWSIGSWVKFALTTAEQQDGQ